MPSEHRVITFGPTEILKAIEIKLLDDSMPRLEKGELVSVHVDKGDSETPISIEILHEGHDQTKAHKYSREFFVLALVFYCRGHNIPLPSKGLKNLHVREKEIVMEIKMGEAK